VVVKYAVIVVNSYLICQIAYPDYVEVVMFGYAENLKDFLWRKKMFRRKKNKEQSIIQNRKATPDGVITLIECPNCHREVEHLYFHCVRCGIQTCAFCSEHTTIPYEHTNWCLDCYKWARENSKNLIKERFGKTL